MRRDLALVAVFALLMFSFANPLAYVDSCTRGDEHQEAMFSTAADGDESSESLISFSETLEDDVMSYPDHNTTYDLSGEMNSATWTLFNNEAGDSFSETASYVTLHAELSTSSDEDYLRTQWPNVTADHYMVTFDYKTNDTAVLTFRIFDSDDRSGGNIDTLVGNAADWTTLALTSTAAMTGIESFEVQASEGGAVADDVAIDIRNLILHDVVYNPTFTGYAESFADVSDWEAEAGFAGTITTDGDVATITETTDTYCRMTHTFGSPQDFDGYYLEYRTTATTAESYRVSLYGGTNWFFVEGFGTNLGTKKGYISDATGDSGFDASAVTKITLAVTGDGGTLDIDYLRVGESDEMGWQHDGSTTAGVTNSSSAEKTFTASSDGDILTLNITTDAGALGSAYYYINFDTTATKIDLECDYYPFVEIKARLIGNTGGGAALLFGADGYYSYLDASFQETSWTTFRNNHKAATSVSSIKAAYLYWGAGASKTIEIEIDYVKAFSIANWTYTGSGVGTDDYLYVDSDVLYSHIDDGYIELNHDPALSVAQASYPVYNLTTSGTAPQFSQYVSEWSTYSDDTRGATTSGTVTDIKLKFDSIETLSAIKFIEDGTAPAVVRSSSTPNDPEDDESITLSAVITDTVEVYSVAFNAIVYPTGFSDVDYDATEQADNLWTYEFSSLITGYYCFKIVASDGANNNALTEYAYIELTVREAQIRITTYTFFGASSDFSYMQYSGHISHDCTYNISEWSTTWAKNETHTGSVTEGMFNIAWDKITVDDAEANFTIVFVSGSLSLTIEGYYGTAYKLLRITEIEVMNMEESLALTNITINFYTNKDVDWYVYDRDDDDAVLSSGSSVEGSDDLYFLKNRIPYAHYYAVKWTDGVTDIWYNSSYWTYRQNVDSINPPGTDWGAKDQRKTIEFWVTVGAFIGIGGFIVLGAMHYGLRNELKALQLPHYRTQERDRK